MSRLTTSRAFLIGVVASVGWILLWGWLTRAGGPVSNLFFPSPQAVLHRFLRMWTRPYLGSTLLGHIFSSLSVVLTGWFLAGLVGVPLGITMAWWRRLRWIAFPVFQLVRPGSAPRLDPPDARMDGHRRPGESGGGLHCGSRALGDEFDASC